MHGQWIGTITGTNNGLMMLDLDDAGSHWEGHVFTFDNDPSLPGIVAHLKTENKNVHQNLVTEGINAIHPQFPILLDRTQLSSLLPSVVIPSSLRVSIRFGKQSLNARWISDIGTEGTVRAALSAADKRSSLRPRWDVKTWRQFRDLALSLDSRRYIFRGQDCQKRLRTAFHRSRRKDLVRFIRDDIPRVHHVLTSRTKHLFNLSNNVENAAFLNLIQHHGYPTPLLDWTYSPFVAAFFAYRRRQPDIGGSPKVRIFMFDKAAWETDFNQVQSMTFARPHFSLLEALTIENLRAIPQQAISAVTNVDDVESYLVAMEARTGKSYLQVIDLPADDRHSIMENLSMMGITAGTLFPGLDGACEELRGRYFHPL